MFTLQPTVVATHDFAEKSTDVPTIFRAVRPAYRLALESTDTAT